MKRKALSILLVLAMVLTMMPAMAMTSFAGEKGKVKHTYNWYWEDLAEAKAKAAEYLDEKYEEGAYTSAFQIKEAYNNLINSRWSISEVVKDCKEALDKMDKVQTAVEDGIAAIEKAIYDDDYAEMEALAIEGEEALKAANWNGYNDTYSINAVKNEYLGKQWKQYFKDLGLEKEAAKKKLTDKAAADAKKPLSDAVQAYLDEYNAGWEKDGEGKWTAGLIDSCKTITEVRNLFPAALDDLEVLIGTEYEVVVPMFKAINSGKTVKLSWGKVNGATKYVVYGNICGKKYKKIKTTTSLNYTVKRISGKKLKAHSAYKFKVKAYKGSKVIKTFASCHKIVKTTMGKYANAKSVNAAKALTIAKASKKNVGAKTVIYKNKKHLKSNHGAALRYYTNNSYVCSVDAKGNVTAKHLGTAQVYSQDISGIWTATTVSVE